MMKNKQGFTLVELLITVVIVGILAAVVFPSYTDYVARSARAEAVSMLSGAAAKQEQYYMDHRSYADSLSKLGVANTANSKLYKFDIAVASGSFTIKATALAQQASRDKDCTPLSIDSAGNRKPEGCW
ncbi:type IV pilin protein [Paraferrimonas haliotis]|uniref:Type IV minor pilin protein PilE n=1 Tax=Paraferrimonas haliotis TaxID=2013866 RepID=A0AA37WVV9_9GAMM|nr:type IV pilin protein [Paraferrimonas haliotis]GLS82562.1 type IV minor pilin protein PilE [Paraferrimonas haliotis]